MTTEHAHIERERLKKFQEVNDENSRLRGVVKELEEDKKELIIKVILLENRMRLVGNLAMGLVEIIKQGD